MRRYSVSEESTAYQPPKTLWNASYLLILAVSTLSSFSFYMTATGSRYRWSSCSSRR